MMRSRWIVGIAIAASLFATTQVSADVGPKPQMHFAFVYQIGQVSIVSGQQIECNDAACADERPLMEAGPQRFTCGPNECQSLAYGYSRYHKLIIQFADRTRESNIFESSGGSFIVTVREQDLFVRVDRFAQFSSPVPYLVAGIALFWTLVTELPVATIYLSIRKISKRVLLWILAANVLSVPILWLLFPILQLDWLPAFILSEATVIVFEALFLYRTNKQILSLKESTILSIVTNVASILIGLGFASFLAAAIYISSVR